MFIRRVLILVAILILFMNSYAVAYENEIKGISVTIGESIAKSGKKTIAVVDFTGLQGNVTELGRFLAEELSVELVTTASHFSVIDRAHLKSILAEHKLSISGIADPKAVKKLGQIAGVDAIITGSVTPLENSIRMTTKVIATDTANVIGAAKCDIAKTRAIEELLSRGIDTGQVSSSTESYIPSSQSKKVGPIVVTIKKIIVSPEEQVRVILDFNNQTDKSLSIIEDHFGNGNYPKLTDENGNVFVYEQGDIRNELILNAKSNSAVVLYFKPKHRKERYMNTNEKLGPNFSVTIPFLLDYDWGMRKKPTYSVSFTGIKAQMPK